MYRTAEAGSDQNSAAIPRPHMTMVTTARTRLKTGR